MFADKICYRLLSHMRSMNYIFYMLVEVVLFKDVLLRYRSNYLSNFLRLIEFVVAIQVNILRLGQGLLDM